MIQRIKFVNLKTHKQEMGIKKHKQKLQTTLQLATLNLKFIDQDAWTNKIISNFTINPYKYFVK